jgi:uncharacterized protein (DUF1499 family)
MKKLGTLFIAAMTFFSCAGQRPDNLGINNNQLTPCPDSPNCVSSQAASDRHFIEPFTYQGDKTAAIDKLKSKIASMGQLTLVQESDGYLRYECTSKIMGFVDDLEFFFTEDALIHVRSASRLGYSDFGVNRKRVEAIRHLFYPSTS